MNHRHPHPPRRRENERGSFLAEGAIILLAMALCFMGLLKLGLTAMDEQKVQSATDRAAWYAISGTAFPERPAGVTIEGSGLYQWSENPHAAHPHVSLPLDGGGG